jgi:hypothetical protein
VTRSNRQIWPIWKSTVLALYLIAAPGGPRNTPSRSNPPTKVTSSHTTREPRQIGPSPEGPFFCYRKPYGKICTKCRSIPFTPSRPCCAICENRHGSPQQAFFPEKLQPRVYWRDHNLKRGVLRRFRRPLCKTITRCSKPRWRLRVKNHSPHLIAS